VSSRSPGGSTRNGQDRRDRAIRSDLQAHWAGERPEIAPPQENENLQRLLHRGGLYELAAQHFGLNEFIQFERFPGRAQYVIPLEVAFEQVLAGWLPVEAPAAM
jgi:hypothetical protein